VLDQIDRVLRREQDLLPAARTPLSGAPNPIPMVSTANLSLSAAAAPAIQMISTAQLSLAAAIMPAIQMMSTAQLSLVAAVAPAIRMISAGQLSLTAGFSEPLSPNVGRFAPADEVETPSATAHLERCLQEIEEWLGVGLSDAAQASGIDRGTVYAWRRRRSEPRPATVGAVLRLRSLVASVVSGLGAEQAREWFHAGSPSPLARLLAAEGDGAIMAAVAREARRAYTTLPPPNPLLGSTVDDLPARPLA